MTTTYLRILFFSSLLFTGIFYEYAACFINIGLLLFLCVVVKQKGAFVLRWNFSFIYVLVLAATYLLSFIWAVDSNMAFWGFLKFSPVLLFVTLLMQIDENQEDLLMDLPLVGVIMTVASFIGSLIPALEGYVTVSDRLAGTFQYPNTFALFLLLCLVYLLFNNDINYKSVLCAGVLIGGIFLSGSRTVFVLTGLPLIICTIIMKEKKRRLFCGIIFGCILVAVIVLFIMTADGDVRLLTLSLMESTLLGRVLYWIDALPVILKNPLGLGWMGYYFTQGSFQTGVYSVVYAHNDFLQTFLDVGWLAGIMLIGVFIYGIKNAGHAWKRLMLILLGLHCIMDFDLQFTAMYMVFLLLLPWERGRQKKWKSGRWLPVAAVCCSMGFAYCVIANLGYYFGSDVIAEKLPPQNTMWQMEKLEQAKNPAKMQVIAEEILQHNESVSLAWSAGAAAAFAQGDIEIMMQCKRAAIERAKYQLNEYMDYIYMLSVSANMFLEAQDAASYRYCLQEIVLTGELLEQVKEDTHPLAWKLDDKPELELPEEYKDIITEAKKLITDEGGER